MPDVFYVWSPREWPLVARIGAAVALTGVLALSAWLVTRPTLPALAGGAALGAAGAGLLAVFARGLGRPRWYRIEESELVAHDGRRLAFASIGRVAFENRGAVREIVLNDDWRIPLFRGRRDELVHAARFLALLEDRLRKPQGSLARAAREEVPA